MPIVRTFAPIVAGIAQMDLKVFWIYNIISGVIWSTALVLLGYFLGNILFVREHLEIIILLVIFISFLPAIIEYLKEKRKSGT